MGCCINYFIGFENAEVLDDVLAMTARRARALGFEVVRFDVTPGRGALLVNPHPNCDTLALEFMRVEDWASSDESLFLGEEVKGTNWGESLPRKCTFPHKGLW